MKPAAALSATRITFVVGFINALVHAKDGFAAMPSGLILSAVVVAVLTVDPGWTPRAQSMNVAVKTL